MAPTCPCISKRGMPHYVEKPAENGHKERPKKKRWSFGGLFRRKSKKGSDTSSDEEEGKGFLRRKKQTGSKDVTGSFVVQGVGVARRVGGSTGSLDIQNRRMAKAKVEASREALESSSGDEGSYSSSLASGGGGSLNRKSRAARTERYMRRKCDQWSPSPTRRTGQGLEQRSGSEQIIPKKVKAPLYIPPPPPVRPPTVSSRSISDQYLSPPPIPHRKPLPSLTNSELSIASTRSDSSNYRDFIHPVHSVSHDRNELKKPPTPPERRSSRHSMVIPERNSSNLEQALNELEAIYNSLRLGDDEVDKNVPYRTNSKSGLDSNFSTSQNSLSKRRPDKQSDDMAYRRWNKRNPNMSDTREIISQAGSYLLLSPTMTPPHSFHRDPNEPHITLDDVVYRNINHTNNTLKILDPQPPFGIPLGPVTPAPQSDYLHVSPSQSSQNLYKTKHVPDVVLDDLAFRNLRKDAQDSTVNIKKKKATRSLSANLANLIIPNDKTHPIRGDYYEVNNNLDEYRSPSYSDIPKDLRLAQRMLDIRLMNLRNKIKDQERAKMNSSSETLHHSNRSNSGTPERRTPTREPQRARFGADGQFKYSDLHPRTPPERRIVFREEWRRPATPEKKVPCKEELRKKFFADAYRNLDRTNVWTKPTQKLTENPHHKLHFSHSKNQDPARMKPPRAEVNKTVGLSTQQNSLRKSPIPHRTLTGDYFFPKDFEVPKQKKAAANEVHLAAPYQGYMPRNRAHSPHRKVPSPHPATPPSSPARTHRSSQLPNFESMDNKEVTVKPKEKSESALCNGHGHSEKMIFKNEIAEVQTKIKDKDASQGTDSDSGRATPSGEEVRRILCPEEVIVKSEEEKEEEREREENELLKKLEEEATATSLEMDRELMSLTVSLPQQSSKVDDRQNDPEVSSKRVADLLRELTRSLDYDFGPDRPDDASSSSCMEVMTKTTVQHNDTPSGIIVLAYCLAVAQQLSTVDALTLFALVLAVISVFLFVYL